MHDVFISHISAPSSTTTSHPTLSNPHTIAYFPQITIYMRVTQESDLAIFGLSWPDPKIINQA